MRAFVKISTESAINGIVCSVAVLYRDPTTLGTAPHSNVHSTITIFFRFQQKTNGVFGVAFLVYFGTSLFSDCVLYDAWSMGEIFLAVWQNSGLRICSRSVITCICLHSFCLFRVRAFLQRLQAVRVRFAVASHPFVCMFTSYCCAVCLYSTPNQQTINSFS